MGVQTPMPCFPKVDKQNKKKRTTEKRRIKSRGTKNQQDVHFWRGRQHHCACIGHRDLGVHIEAGMPYPGKHQN